ncbi:protein PhlB-like [Littorina saxatilis]|uniref:SOCS box domain-containing protein n=1 Tax=Littorina saxatilis TaxID=31220 RepID=A0AAN9AZP1_9CAEN
MTNERTGFQQILMTSISPGLPNNTNAIFQKLREAIESGHVISVEELLAKEWTQGDNRNSALFEFAVKSRQLNVIRCLLRHGVVPLRESPIFSAIQKIEALQVVLAERHSVHVTSSTLKTPLHVAVTVNTAAIPILVSAGCDVTTRDGVQGDTPLHTACTKFQEDAILLLMQAGAHLNTQNWRCRSPLHCLLHHSHHRHDFHSKSRRDLARCLVHVGMTMVTSSSRHQSLGQRNSQDNRVYDVYRRLLKETRRSISSLQHLCRVTVRGLCEGGGGRRGGNGGGEVSLAAVIEKLEVSCYLKEYLLYKQHVFDRAAFHPETTRVLDDWISNI